MPDRRLNLWRWGLMLRTGGQLTPWPWWEIRFFRRVPRKTPIND